MAIFLTTEELTMLIMKITEVTASKKFQTKKYPTIADRVF